jgi:pectin methylesterase-like acyl-CoA thioesterase
VRGAAGTTTSASQNETGNENMTSLSNLAGGSSRRKWRTTFTAAVTVLALSGAVAVPLSAEAADDRSCASPGGAGGLLTDVVICPKELPAPTPTPTRRALPEEENNCGASSSTTPGTECTDLINRFIGPQRSFPRDLYRADGRPPSEIFRRGFTARGTNYDVPHHVHGGNQALDSGWISTTGTRSVAEYFLRSAAMFAIRDQLVIDLARERANCTNGPSWQLIPGLGGRSCVAETVTARTYVYVIDPAVARNAIYVPDQLRNVTAGDDLRNMFQQDEWAYAHHIPATAIVGVRVYQVIARRDGNGVGGMPTRTFDHFEPNPQYMNRDLTAERYLPNLDADAGFDFITALGLIWLSTRRRLEAGATVTVAADGSGDFKKVQDAINALPGDGRARTISIAKGIYHEAITVPANRRGLTIKGATGNASDVVIYNDRAHGMAKPGGGVYGTQGSATATFRASDMTVTGVKIMNTFNPSQHPEIGPYDTQAVALAAIGDRQVYSNSQFISTQDTVLVKATAPTAQTRQYFRDVYIKGTVDYLFGDATAVFDHSYLEQTDRGRGLGGNIVAPNTDSSKKYGILITNSTIASKSAADTFTLGRPWHNTPTAIGQTLIRDSVLPIGIKKAAPWTDMMPDFSWRSARFFEYNNTGPGTFPDRCLSGCGPSSRPELSAAQAGDYTAAKYLAGTDGWNPTW